MGRMGFNVSLFQEKAGIGEPVAGELLSFFFLDF